MQQEGDAMIMPMKFSKELMAETTMEEVKASEHDIEEWKKSKGLPPQYGTIIEDEKYWTILKRVEYPMVMGLPFRNVIFALSGDPKTKRLYIHSIQYPKEGYTREWIEKMTFLTTNCPYCMDGTQFIELPQLSNFLSSTTITKSRSEGTTMFDKLFARVGMSKGEISATDIIGNLIVTGIVGNAVDSFTKGDQTLRRNWKTAIGLVSSLGAAGLSMYPPIGKHKTILKHATLMGWNMLFAAVDISPAEMREWQQGVKNAWSQMLGYGPAQGIKAMFVRKPIGYGGPATGPKELFPLGKMKMEGSSGGFVVPLESSAAQGSPLMVRRQI